MKRKFGLICILAVSVVGMPLTAGAAEVVLKAVSALPTNTPFTQQFLEFVENVNSDPELDVKIQYLGGPEVIPKKSQDYALKSGVVDMVYSPANYFYGSVPAVAALGAATIDASAARKNGGIAYLNSLFKKKLNSYFLGWFGAIDEVFNIYTIQRPKFTEDGQFKGEVRIRSTAFYRDVIAGMGGSPVNVSVPNVYTALQRGVVTGVAWPTIGITNLGWDDFIRYRIEPGFFRMNTIVLMNLDSWKQLTKEQQQKLQSLAIKFEAESKKAFAQKRSRIKTKLDKIKSVELKGNALERYKKLIRAAPWKTLRRYGGGAHEEELRSYFTPDKAK